MRWALSSATLLHTGSAAFQLVKHFILQRRFCRCIGWAKYFTVQSAQILAPFVIGENTQFFGRKALLKDTLVLGGLSAFKISQKREALLFQRMQRARGDVILLVSCKMVFQLLDALARPQQLH